MARRQIINVRKRFLSESLVKQNNFLPVEYICSLLSNSGRCERVDVDLPDNFNEVVSCHGYNGGKGPSVAVYQVSWDRVFFYQLSYWRFNVLN